MSISTMQEDVTPITLDNISPSEEFAEDIPVKRPRSDSGDASPKQRAPKHRGRPRRGRKPKGRTAN